MEIDPEAVQREMTRQALCTVYDLVRHDSDLTYDERYRAFEWLEAKLRELG
jgi:hypothetical protein